MHSTEAQGELYCGADLHGNNVFLSVCDSLGNEIMARRVKATLPAVNAALAEHWPRIRVFAVESTFNWYWLVDGLRAEGRDVRLANPAKMEQYKGLKVGDDACDARWIAEMQRLGILPEAYVYPPEQRPLRDLLRRRALLVRQRTQAMLSLEGLLARHGLPCPRADALKKWTAREVQGLALDEDSRFQAETLLEMLRTADTLARGIESRVKGTLKERKEYQRLQSVPGIGPILGMVIALESGDFGRFASAGDYASYCRAVKSERSSNGKKKGENNRKNGNPYLAWAFSEAAVYAMRFHETIRRWYERKKGRRCAPVAMRAVACKLAKATWHVMRGGEYQEQLLFG
jgi:transposase